MAHINDLIDFAVAVYVVHNDKVLFINHKQLNIWLPLGGHIELDEDPEHAAVREVKEESGLDIQLFGEKPRFERPGVKSLIAPPYLNIHQINETHRHVGFIYFATSKTDKIELAVNEHNDIRWLSLADLDKPEYNLYDDVKYYGQKALFLFT